MSSNGTLSPEAQRHREQLRNGGMLPAPLPIEDHLPTNARKGRTAVRNPDSIERFKTMNDFADLSARSVDTTAQAVWWILFRETKPNGHSCISHSQIAVRIGSCRRTVVRATQQLEAAKLISVVRRGGLNGGTSTYKVHGTSKGV